MSLAAFSIRRPVFAWMLMTAAIVFGTICFTRLGVSKDPDVDAPFVSISATLEGAAPEVMESDVADVLEDAVMGVEGVKEVSSTCKQGNADVRIEFDIERDVDQAMQEVTSKVSQAAKNLPQDLDPPIVTKQNPEDEPIMWFALTGTKAPRQLSEYARNVLRDKLLTVPGVADVRMGGFLQRNVRIWLQAEKLRALGLGIDQVILALQRQHVELPAGRLDAPTRIANVRVEGEALSTEQIRAIEVANREGSPVYLRDVALVEDGFEDRTRVARSDGVPAQGMGVIKQRGFSAVEVAKAVRERVKAIKGVDEDGKPALKADGTPMARELPEGMDLSIRVDQTTFIARAIHEIEMDIGLAVLLTAIICWLFLGSISSTVNVTLAIPVALLGTFAVMYFAGFTLNTYTLLAISLSIGIVVDDAIMVLENIYRHAEHGEDRVTAARRGTEEISGAALAATLAIAAIFLPVAFMTGIIGKYFFQFGIVISVAVFLSLIEAMTMAPARCSQFLTVGRTNRVEKAVGAAFTLLARGYKWLLGLALNWRATVLGGSSMVFLSALLFLDGPRKAMLPKFLESTADKVMGEPLKQEFSPAWDQGFFMIRFELPVGSSIDRTDAAMKQLEAVVDRHPGVEGKLAIAGAQDLNSGFMFVSLKDHDTRKKLQSELREQDRAAARDRLFKLPPEAPPAMRTSLEKQAKEGRDFTQQGIIAELRPQLGVFPGVRAFPLDFSNQAPGGGGRSFPVDFTIRGGDWETLGKMSDKALAVLRDAKTDRGQPLVTDLNTDYRIGLPEVQVIPDRERCLANNVDVQSVAQVVNSLIGGQRVAKFKDNGRRYDVRVRLVQDQRVRPDDIANLYVRNRDGRLISLGEITTIHVEPSVQSITRKQRERAVTITANIPTGSSQGEALAYVRGQQFIKDLELPAGYRVVLSGASQTAQESFDSLLFAMLLGVFTAYMVLASQFNSFHHPITILLAMPFSFTGAFLALSITGITLNVYSMIGLILLLGIVKKNSILLVDYTNHIRNLGKPTREALLEACPVRLRPILMTTAAMICGALPGAMSRGIGHELRQPMSVCVIGGLIVSTMLTLLVVPCFYSLVDQGLGWLSARWRRWRGAAPVEHAVGESVLPVAGGPQTPEAFGK